VVAAYLFAAAANIDPSYLLNDANMHPLQKEGKGVEGKVERRRGKGLRGGERKGEREGMEKG